MASSHQPIWALPITAVYQSLNSSASGLSEDEAARRLQQFGANELPEPVQRPLWLRFTDQLTHFMALLLWVAGTLAFISRTPELGWAIWAVIWINAIFSFWQEFQAEQPLQERVNPAEIANLVLAGSTVAAGRAVAVVYATGTQTEFGQVAHLTTEVKREPSTLEVQITRIVRIITAIAIGKLRIYGWMSRPI